ncbi:glycosyltransferase [Burkholderia sp. Bp9017]|uniref:glycosyltransferase family 2 protein n=1 Tax=unclassified Burkholderia TaxID=2613784 RepID=UPI000F5E0BE9|nr:MULTISPECIES: glycosyltransferase [unclassified Burkholderia]RQZ28611.1 glycosyltransferase [Burkholderia sp. Bp9017]RQZ35105.1 glycosyltransferase [Burkholderia sp. Bp9016]
MTRITTMIPTYNQEGYIDATIASAVEQTGNFTHEILISSDGSTDETRAKIQSWQKKFPMLIRDLSSDANVGISENFRRLFARASGDYIAILEGDDLWTDPEKLEKQKNFLNKNNDCSMVFSMIRVKQLSSGKEFLLDRQVGIAKDKLGGEDFLADPLMNLIANFSSCMLRTAVVRELPDRLFVERFNEIAMAFFFERFGQIGFLKQEMSIYHQHEGGVWSGMSREAQLRSGLEARKMVFEVAHDRHKAKIRQIMEDRYIKPLAKLQVGA